jgi:endoglucanase
MGLGEGASAGRTAPLKSMLFYRWRKINAMRLTLLFLMLLPAPLTGGSEGFVGVRGTEIVLRDGSPLRLRGVNLGNWLVPEGYMFKFTSASSPRRIETVLNQLIGPEEANTFWKRFRDFYVTHDDIRYIKSLGLNSVRVPFNARLFVLEEYPDVWLPTGFEMLDRIVEWCTRESLYVILDMHCAPGGQTGDNIDDSHGYPFFFESPEAERLATEIWTKIAQRYSTEAWILGYDLLNEPIPHFYDMEKLNPRLEPTFRRMTRAIRAVDTNHIIFLGGAQWNTNFSVFGSPFDAKLVYTFHKYWMPPTNEEIQEYIDFREKHNVPVWMGESGENGDAWIDSFRVVLERNAIGWCFWPYKKMNSSRCPVTFDQPEGYDAVIAFAEAPRTSFEELRRIRPDIRRVREALAQFLENCRFENCRPNRGYLRALGLELNQARERPMR